MHSAKRIKTRYLSNAARTNEMTTSELHSRVRLTMKTTKSRKFRYYLYRLQSTPLLIKEKEKRPSKRIPTWLPDGAQQLGLRRNWRGLAVKFPRLQAVNAHPSCLIRYMPPPRSVDELNPSHDRKSPMIYLQTAKTSIKAPPSLMPLEFDPQPLRHRVTEPLLKKSEVQPNHP